MENTKPPPSRIVKYGGGFLAVTCTMGLLAAALIPKEEPTQASQQLAPSQAPDPAIGKAQAVADAVAKSFGIRPNIDRVEIQDVKANNYTYNVWYKTPPTYAQAKADASELIRSTLKKAVLPGTNTQDKWIFIHAHAYIVTKGETRDLVRALAKASYNFNEDRIEFEVKK